MTPVDNKTELLFTGSKYDSSLDIMVTKNDIDYMLNEFATKNDVRTIVREETSDIRDELLRHSEQLDEIGNKVDVLNESVSDSLKLTETVKNLVKRAATLESKSKIIMASIRQHSAEIKDLQNSHK